MKRRTDEDAGYTTDTSNHKKAHHTTKNLAPLLVTRLDTLSESIGCTPTAESPTANALTSPSVGQTPQEDLQSSETGLLSPSVGITPPTLSSILVPTLTYHPPTAINTPYEPTQPYIRLTTKHIIESKAPTNTMQARVRTISLASSSSRVTKHHNHWRKLITTQERSNKGRFWKAQPLLKLGDESDTSRRIATLTSYDDTKLAPNAFTITESTPSSPLRRHRTEMTPGSATRSFTKKLYDSGAINPQLPPAII